MQVVALRLRAHARPRVGNTSALDSGLLTEYAYQLLDAAGRQRLVVARAAPTQAHEDPIACGIWPGAADVSVEPQVNAGAIGTSRSRPP